MFRFVWLCAAEHFIAIFLLALSTSQTYRDKVERMNFARKKQCLVGNLTKSLSERQVNGRQK